MLVEWVKLCKKKQYYCFLQGVDFPIIILKWDKSDRLWKYDIFKHDDLRKSVIIGGGSGIDPMVAVNIANKGLFDTYGITQDNIYYSKNIRHYKQRLQELEFSWADYDDDKEGNYHEKCGFTK